MITIQANSYSLSGSLVPKLDLLVHLSTKSPCSTSPAAPAAPKTKLNSKIAGQMYVCVFVCAAWRESVCVCVCVCVCDRVYVCVCSCRPEENLCVCLCVHSTLYCMQSPRQHSRLKLQQSEKASCLQSYLPFTKALPMPTTDIRFPRQLAAATATTFINVIRISRCTQDSMVCVRP